MSRPKRDINFFPPCDHGGERRDGRQVADQDPPATSRKNRKKPSHGDMSASAHSRTSTLKSEEDQPGAFASGIAVGRNRTAETHDQDWEDNNEEDEEVSPVRATPIDEDDYRNRLRQEILREQENTQTHARTIDIESADTSSFTKPPVVEDMTSSRRGPHDPKNDSNPRQRFYICVAIGCAILAMIAAAVGLAVGLSRKTGPSRPPDVVPGSAVPTFLNFCSDIVSRYQTHNSNMECSCDETTNTVQCKVEVDSNGYIQVKLQYNDATGGYSATDCECQDSTCLNPTPTCITLSFNGQTQLSSVDAPLQASCFVTDETLQGSPYSVCQVCEPNAPFIQVNVEGCPNADPSQLGCIQTHVINNKFLGGQPSLETTQPTERPAPAPSLPPNSEPTEPLSECQALCQGQGLKGIPVTYSDTDDFKRAIISYMKDPLLSPHGSNINCWDVSQVSDMSGAFRFISPEWGGAIHDTELDDPILQTFNEDLNCWDTSSVTTMRLMFANATSFNGKIDNWDVSQVTDMGWMFAFASVFNGDLSSWQVGNVVYMEYMFAGAANFNAGIGDWDTSSVFDMQSMFELAANFNADISKWDTSGVLYMDYMFNQASRFNQPIGGWDTSRVIDMSLMFASAVTFSQDIGFWQVGNVRDMYAMFAHATTFDNPIGQWDVTNVQNMSSMFYGASSFNQPLGDWSTISLTNSSLMFEEATSFNQPIGTWDTSKLEDMSFMFSKASDFSQPLNLWDVSSVKTMRAAFFEASSFDHPLSLWDVSQCEDFAYMFNRADYFNQLLETWDVSKAKQLNHMFFGAFSFNQNLCSWGSLVNVSNTSDIEISGIFEGSGCDDKSEPSTTSTSWCQPCAY